MVSLLCFKILSQNPSKLKKGKEKTSWFFNLAISFNVLKVNFHKKYWDERCIDEHEKFASAN